MASCHKLGIVLENKVILKWMLSKHVNNKKCAPKFIFFNEKKSERFRMIFDKENLSRMRVAILFKSIFCDLKTSKCEFFSKRENKGLKRSKRQIELQIAKECLIFLLALTFESKDNTKRQRHIIQQLKMRYQTVTVFLLNIFINTIQGPPWIAFQFD